MKSSGSEIWSELLDSSEVRGSLAESGFFPITSANLNQFSKPRGGPDARNLVKYDSSDRLPGALRREGLAFLPRGRGDFVVGPFVTYLQTREEDFRDLPLRKFTVSSNFETLNTENINSESSALMVAHSSGMLADFLGEDAVHTGFGKGSTNEFSFQANRRSFPPMRIHVSSTMPMEIDGIYETRDSIALIEAKNLRSRDFHVRQLYYPMRTFGERHKKKVKTILLTQFEGIFELREVVFEDPGNISSFSTLKLARYGLGNELFGLTELRKMCEQPAPFTAPADVTFPQANKFEKVLFVIEQLLIQPLMRDEIANLFGYAPRQGDYYARAGMYLGLVSKIDREFHATEKAREVFSLSGAQRTRELARLLTSVPTIRQGIRAYFSIGNLPTQVEILNEMRKQGESDELNPTTENRRASTAADWMDWLISNSDSTA